MNTKVTRVSIFREVGHPTFNCLNVYPEDEAGGSYLVIEGMREIDPDTPPGPPKISLDWDEWDKLVEVVQQHRKEWEWE